MVRKILFVHDFAQMGGAEKALLDLVAGLDRTEFASSVLLFEKGPFSAALAAVGAQTLLVEFPEQFLRLPFRPGPMQAARLGGAAFGLIGRIMAVARMISRGDYDFVITNSLKALVIVALARYGRRGAPRHWHYLHYMLPEKRGVATRLISWFLSRPDCLVCNSQATLDQARRQRVVCKKTAVVRQGFDRTKPLAPEPGATDWIVGTAGRLSPVKNLGFIVDVARIVRAKHPNIRVCIAGEAYTESDRAYEGGLRKHIAESGMGDVVSFNGFVDDIWGFMDSLHVFMLSSHTESFGRVLAEAMWSGKPIIATRVGAIPEIVQNGVTGYTVAAGDVQSAAQLLESLIEKPSELSRIGMSGRTYAEANLSYRSYVAAWRALLLER